MAKHSHGPKQITFICKKLREEAKNRNEQADV
jgi:hypothetical protein